MALTLDEVDLANPDNFVDSVPHEMFDVLRREAPVYWHPEAEGHGFWAVTRHADVSNLNRDWSSYSSERGGITIDEMDDDVLAMQRQMMLIMDPPRHTKLRLLVNRGFTPRMVGRLQDHVRDMAAAIAGPVAERGSCDFVVDVAAELPLQVISEMMGVPGDDRHRIFEWSNRLIGSVDPEYTVSDEQAMDAATEMFLYSAQLAAARREDLRDDIVSALLTAEVDGERLTDTEFNLFFQLLSVAGNETTRNLVSHGMLAFIEHPDQWSKLRANRDLLPGAIEEMLRWGTPVMYFRRTAQGDMELEGQLIREGDKVAIWYASANRDESVFVEPHRFDIERHPNEHVAFGGGGPHFCLGANLARLEIRLMFEALLDRVEAIELDGPVQRLRSNFINGIKHMPVRLIAA